MSRGIRTHVVAAAIVLIAGSASAQDDVLSRARVANSSGQRAQALAMLERHLSVTPRDVDARLLYGLMLSWDGRYDEARGELRQVLVQAPDYKDARIALMNVEWWSGRTVEAGDLAAQILTGDPGNPQARLTRQRLDARGRPWSITTGYSLDGFNDGGDPWHEFEVAIGRQTSRGSIFVRGTNAARFGYRDQLVELEAYPRLRPGTYAYVSAGVATSRDLFPEYRAALDLYQSLGRGIEVSGGYRRLQFLSPVSIYVGTATKYLGRWAVTERVYFVPGDESNSWSFHTESRRYLGSTGTSFIGATYSHGFNREEPRGLGDSIRLRSNTVRGQANIDVSPWARFMITVSTSRQTRALRTPLWQTTVTAGTGYRF
jgi:YaiO family outer membrane protein